MKVRGPPDPQDCSVWQASFSLTHCGWENELIAIPTGLQGENTTVMEDWRLYQEEKETLDSMS